ncbi:MAG: exonuclease small subunit [Verrucomicrobiales bacterium]|nr:exonuclease small subunit [Verrucomicrobiales bacterium]
MSKPEPGSGSSISALAEMPFEEALQKLESIVEAMESDDLPLETLLGKYEEGTKMSQICQAKMAEAELKIQQLEKNSKGELTVKAINFDAPAE